MSKDAELKYKRCLIEFTAAKSDYSNSVGYEVWLSYKDNCPSHLGYIMYRFDRQAWVAGDHGGYEFMTKGDCDRALICREQVIPAAKTLVDYFLETHGTVSDGWPDNFYDPLRKQMGTIR
jgi:hypothetical protein